MSFSLSQLLKPFRPFSQKKYLIALSIFVIWVAFFDQSNIVDQVKGMSKMKDIENAKDFYREKIKIDSVQLYQLKTDKSNLEKFAREQFLMKKSNEDVFIIVDEN